MPWNEITAKWNDMTGRDAVYQTIHRRWDEVRKRAGEFPPHQSGESARGSHTSTHQQPRGDHAALATMTTNARIPTEAPSTSPAKMARMVSTRPSTSERTKPIRLFLPKRWIDADSEDILLFQMEQSGATWSQIAVKWNEMTGHDYAMTSLQRRMRRIRRAVGDPPQHLMDLDVKARFQSSKGFQFRCGSSSIANLIWCLLQRAKARLTSCPLGHPKATMIQSLPGQAKAALNWYLLR